MTGTSSRTPFDTDDGLALRIRTVASRLDGHTDAVAELLEVARILDPDGADPPRAISGRLFDPGSSR